jgi:hypothetical protein
VIAPAEIDGAIRLVRAEESWEAPLFGGLIPFIGAGAVIWLIWRAVKSNPENDLPPEERLGHDWVHGVPPEGHPLAQDPVADETAKKEGGPEDPPS